MISANNHWQSPSHPSPPSEFSAIWARTNDMASSPITISRENSFLRRRPSSRNDHPLGRAQSNDASPPDSRPSLRRLTSETERYVAESSRSGSDRGSLDLLRMSTVEDGTGNGRGRTGECVEVEVLIHEVSQRKYFRTWMDNIANEIRLHPLNHLQGLLFSTVSMSALVYCSRG